MTTKTHPSYGMLRISRTHGGNTRLFGSPITTHPGYINLAIAHGEHEFSLGEDRFYGHKDIIRIKLSYAQFAEAITSLGYGSGVPCTIENLNGEMVEDPPNEPLEVEKVKEEFQNKCNKLDNNLSTYFKVINSLLDKKTISKNDRESIRQTLKLISTEIRSNLPFYLDQFNEAVERITTTAKTEIDGFMTTVLRAAGMEKLAEGSFSGFLPGKKKEK